MMLIRNLDDLPASLQSGAVTIGNFDGVHRGHAALLQRLTALAQRVGGPSVVFTFDPHPASLLHPASVPPPLTWTARKAELLFELGADVVVAYPTDRSILSLSPRAFFSKIVLGALRARAIVEGPNFFFGCGRSGTIDDLQSFCHESKLEFEVVDPLQEDGKFISSSWIRKLILAGDVRKADLLLTRPYRIRGTVVRGAGRGATIGFPTANVEPLGMVLPPLGVYAGRAYVDGTSYAAAANLGPNPTFDEKLLKFEVHLLGCNRPLYGETLELDFLARLRDVQTFESVEHLQAQLANDVEAVRRCLQ